MNSNQTNENTYRPSLYKLIRISTALFPIPTTKTRFPVTLLNVALLNRTL